MSPNKICLNCKKKFYSTKGKENCAPCSRLLGLIKPYIVRRSSYYKLKRTCEDVSLFERDIYLLATKFKWNLISPVDIYRVADLYIKVTCNDLKYSTNDPERQAEIMIKDLVELLELKKQLPTIARYKARSIVQLSKNGRVIRTFNSIKHAVEVLDYTDSTIKRACNGKKTIIKEILKWKADI